MFQPTKIQFSIVLSAAVLVGGASYLRAQSAYPAPLKTPGAAATAFYALLSDVASSFDGKGRVRYLAGAYEGSLDTTAFPTVIARSQWQTLQEPEHDPLPILLNLVRLSKQSQLETRVSGVENGATIVQVTPTSGQGREVVTIAEDGGYRVDLKATYGRWSDLSGQALDLKWFQLSGIAAPSLLNNPTVQRARENARRSSCQSNLKQQALGIIQYAQDYDEKLPPARRWVDVVYPYVKSQQVFQCPSLRATVPNGYGYAFNQYLSQKPQDSFDPYASTVMVYETSNPARNWFGPGTGRAYRHLGGSNISFADGHVKWFAKGKESGVVFKPRFTAK